MAEPNIYFFNDTIYKTNGSTQKISLASYENFRNLVLNENLFIVLFPNADIGFYAEHEKTGMNAPFEFTYDSSTGLLSYSTSHVGTEYYFTLQFKILIIK